MAHTYPVNDAVHAGPATVTLLNYCCGAIMAWKPWYERMVEMDSAEERSEFVRGVFGAPKPMTGRQAAGMALSALMAGVIGYQIAKPRKKK